MSINKVDIYENELYILLLQITNKTKFITISKIRNYLPSN